MMFPAMFDQVQAFVASLAANPLLASLALIMASMLAGVGFGLAKKGFSAGEKKALSLATAGLVVLLIFLMGVKTGLNHRVMEGLGEYGIRALLLALGAIAGSVLLVSAFDRLTSRGAGK